MRVEELVTGFLLIAIAGLALRLWVLSQQRAQLEQQVREQTAVLQEAETKYRDLGNSMQAMHQDRRTAEQRILTLLRAIEQSPVSIVITQATGEIEYANPKFEAVTGYTLAEAIGQNPRVLKSGYQSAEVYQELWSTITSGGEWRGELCNKRKNGEIYWESALIAPIRNDRGDILNYLAIKEDITQRKRMEEELRRRTEEAQSANLAKSQFLANISHEIRTPLNGVIGMIGLLLDTPLSEAQRRYAEVAQASGEALLGLLNDILDFSRLEADSFEVDMLDFDLRVMLEETMEALAARAHGKRLNFIFRIAPSVPAFLRGDPGRLRQILMILGGNAIKFTATGEVAVEVSQEAGTGPRITLRFVVRDTGIGIPQDKIDLLFRAFQQVDGSTTRRFSGVGLGLALAKRLIAKMEGDIGVTSLEGQGSIFWFTAVFGNDAPDHPRYALPLAAELDQVRALVVDDKVTNRLILAEQLASWGIRHQETGSAGQALALLREAKAAGDPFRLLITDMQMPDMDGATLGAAVKADTGLRDAALVMLTSLGRRGDAKRLQDIGFAAYLTKPVRQNQLRDCLVAVLSGAAVERTEPSPLVTRYTLREALRRQTRILLVEDNDINRRIALKMLEKLGYRADAVTSGQQAIRALETFQYNLVFMDVEMPDMDGVEATCRIRSGQTSAPDAQIPIIAMTAHTTQEERERCLAAGMNDHVSKPMNLETFAAILAHWRLDREAKPALAMAVDEPAVMDSRDAGLDLPGLDARRGLRQVGGDRRLYQELLGRFRETQAGTVTAIRGALEQGDLLLAKRLTHTIKGVSGAIGATGVEEAAKVLEQNLSIDGPIEEWLAIFAQRLDDLLRALRDLPLPDTGKHATDVFSTQETPAALSDLLAALDNLMTPIKTRKPKKCAEALHDIQALSWPMLFQADISELGEQIRRYRFAEALALLEALRQRLQSGKAN